MDATMVRPSPKPSWDARSLSRWNGSKMHSVFDALMSGPVFSTITWLSPATVQVVIQTSPAAVL